VGTHQGVQTGALVFEGGESARQAAHCSCLGATELHAADAHAKPDADGNADPDADHGDLSHHDGR